MSNASDFIIENGILKKYVGLGGDVIIPDGVTEIGAEAFAKIEQFDEFSFYTANQDLKSVSLPEGLLKIGNNAFQDCLYLKQIAFPNTVKEISESAFQGTGLNEIQLPKSLKEVGNEAFSALNMWQIIDGNVCIDENGKNTPCRVRIEGNPKFGKLVFGNSYTVDEYCEDCIPVCFDIRDDLPVFPLLLSWTEIDTYTQKTLLLKTLQEPNRFRQADRVYLASAAKKAQRTLYPEICSEIDSQGVSQMCELGMVDVKNADAILEIFRDKPEECTVLLEWITNHITSESRDAVAEKQADRQMEKQVKRNKAIDEAIAAFAKKKPAEIKKEWGVTETEDGLCIAKYKGNDTSIVIPSFIGKDPVIAIGVDALRAAAGKGNDYYGNKNAYQKKMYKNKCIVIQKGIRQIADNAFCGCVYLTDVVIPASVTDIADTAFKDCHKMTIHASAGSYAEQYAKENNIPFVAE